MRQGMGWLLDTRNGPQLTISQKMETSVMQPPGTEIRQQTRMSKETHSPLAPPERNSACQHLDVSLVRVL